MNERCTIEAGADGIARLSGKLTFETVPALYRESESLVRDKQTIRTVDLAAVSTADSAGLALLLEWQSSRGDEEPRLRFENAPESLVRLARLCEADELLDMRDRG